MRSIEIAGIKFATDVETFEAELGDFLKQFEIKENYFNQMLGIVEGQQDLLRSELSRHISILERSYALAVDRAENTYEALENQVYSGLSKGYNELYNSINTGQNLYKGFDRLDFSSLTSFIPSGKKKSNLPEVNELQSSGGDKPIEFFSDPKNYEIPKPQGNFEILEDQLTVDTRWED